jgi:poly-gamma-glutamate system protein
MAPKGFERRDLLLLVAAAVLCAGYLGLGHFSTELKAPWYDEKLAASGLAQKAMAAIKAEKRARGIQIDKTADINETGMIGQRWSGMTTTLGNLEAKRTSTNPDFAAAAVGLLRECGAKKGDRIAVNLSGSFPALSVSVLSAIETLELHPVVIASLGASMWGGNDPTFSWLDMEQVLLERKLIRTGLSAVSLGGAQDVGKDMDDEVRDSLRMRIRAAAVLFIEEPDIEKNVARRTALYLADGVPACFVNVGGNLASGGSEGDFGALRPGLMRSIDEAGAGVGGLIKAFLERKVPVIHLLNLKVLARMYGLPYDPVPQPVPGSGGVFRETRYNLAYIAALLALGLALCVAYVRSGKARR